MSSWPIFEQNVVSLLKLTGLKNEIFILDPDQMRMLLKKFQFLEPKITIDMARIANMVEHSYVHRNIQWKPS